MSTISLQTGYSQNPDGTFSPVCSKRPEVAISFQSVAPILKMLAQNSFSPIAKTFVEMTKGIDVVAKCVAKYEEVEPKGVEANKAKANEPDAEPDAPR